MTNICTAAVHDQSEATHIHKPKKRSAQMEKSLNSVEPTNIVLTSVRCATY